MTTRATSEQPYTLVNNALEQLATTYPEAHREHVERSHQFILGAAEGLSGRALVLGGVPGSIETLTALADQFQGLDIVDIDPHMLTRIKESLPPDLLQKCRLIPLDVTGIIDSHAAFLEGLASDDEKPYVAAVTARFEELAGATRPNPLSSTEGAYDFVVSALVTTELAPSLKRMTAEVARQRFYATNAPITIHNREYNGAYSRLKDGLTNEYLQRIAVAVAPGGRLCVTDTVGELLLSQLMGSDSYTITQPTTPTLASVLRSRLLIQPGMTLHQEAEWQWVQEPPRIPGASEQVSTFGRGYIVDGFILSRDDLTL